MDFYAYPDVAVVCGGLKRDERDASTIINPKVLIEVLSPSTEAYDRGDKFAYYRQAPDLTDYLLVSQDKYRVEHFSKQTNGEWLFKVVDTPGESVNIPSIRCSLALADIYESIGEAEKP
jgi:Uma2 family endonuclease